MTSACFHRKRKRKVSCTVIAEANIHFAVLLLFTRITSSKITSELDWHHSLLNIFLTCLSPFTFSCIFLWAWFCFNGFILYSKKKIKLKFIQNHNSWTATGKSKKANFFIPTPVYTFEHLKKLEVTNSNNIARQ